MTKFSVSKNIRYRKPLKEASIVSVYVHVYMPYVYMPAEADVPKLSRVHIGHERPKIYKLTVV